MRFILSSIILVLASSVFNQHGLLNRDHLFGFFLLIMGFNRSADILDSASSPCCLGIDFAGALRLLGPVNRHHRASAHLGSSFIVSTSFTVTVTSFFFLTA